MYNDNINNIDLYAILELNKNCSKNDIRKSYKRLILKYHPDKHCDVNNSSNNNTNNMFVQVKYAYEILYNDNKRFRAVCILGVNYIVLSIII
jgi:DnaJ family protein C protein 9